MNCYQSSPELSCNCFWENSGEHVAGSCEGAMGQEGNFEADPRFCSPISLDFSLRNDSPCLPGQHPGGDPCGQIGAFGEGCFVPTGACCLASLECIVTSRNRCEELNGDYLGDGIACSPDACEPIPVVDGSWGTIKTLFR